MSATSATQTAACPHAAWTNHDGVTPLVCAACGAIWPGEELPTPPPRHEGYGALADQPGWGERVRRMAAALDRDRDREL